jgi:hypothetical protein
MPNNYFNQEEERYEDVFGISRPHLELLNHTLSLEQKQALIKQRGLEKVYNLQDFEDGEFSSILDADTAKGRFSGRQYEDYSNYLKSAVSQGKFSPEQADEMLNNTEFRFSSSYSRLDALETSTEQERLNRDESKSSYSIFKQRQLIAKKLGKNIDDVTESDMVNYGNYSTNYVANALASSGERINPLEYDPNTRYDKLNFSSSVPVKLKVLGYDDYGRPLVEVINPRTNQYITDDIVKNPYLNATHDLNQLMATPKNLEKMYGESDEEKIKRAYDAIDGDNFFGELVDMSQGSWLNIGVNLVRVLLPKPIERRINESLRADGLPDLDMLVDPVIGQAARDYIVGVNPNTRAKHEQDIGEALLDFTEGRILSGLAKGVLLVPRLLVDSAADIGIMFAATVLTAGVGGVGAATNIARGAYKALSAAQKARVAMGIGAQMSLAVSYVAQNEEEYRYNNNGESRTGIEQILDTAFNFTVLSLESLYMGRAVNLKGLAKTLQPAVDKVPYTVSRNMLLKAAKNIGENILTEGVQEYLQEVESKYASQDQKKKEALLDIMAKPETVFAGFLGGIAGGAMGGGLSIASSVKEKAAAKVEAFSRQRMRNEKDKITLLEESVDEKLNNEAKAQINKVQQIFADKDTEGAKELFNENDDNRKALLAAIYLEGVSVDTTEKAEDLAFKIETAAEREAVVKDPAKAANMSEEEKKATATKYMYAFEPTKTVSPKDIEEYLAPLGLSEEVISGIQKQYEAGEFKGGLEGFANSTNRETVEDEATYGTNGTLTLAARFEKVNQALKAPNLSETQRVRKTAFRDKMQKRMVNFTKSQIKKLNKFSTALKKISEGEKKKLTVKSSNGARFRTFDFDVGQVAGYRSTKGFFSQTEGAIRNIGNLLRSLNTGDTADPDLAVAVKQANAMRMAYNNSLARARNAVAESRENKLDIEAIRKGVKEYLSKKGELSKEAGFSKELIDLENKFFSNMLSADIETLQEAHKAIEEELAKGGGKERQEELSAIEALIAERIEIPLTKEQEEILKTIGGEEDVTVAKEKTFTDGSAATDAAQTEQKKEDNKATTAANKTTHKSTGTAKQEKAAKAKIEPVEVVAEEPNIDNEVEKAEPKEPEKADETKESAADRVKKLHLPTSNVLNTITDNLEKRLKTRAEELYNLPTGIIRNLSKIFTKRFLEDRIDDIVNTVQSLVDSNGKPLQSLSKEALDTYTRLKKELRSLRISRTVLLKNTAIKEAIEKLSDKDKELLNGFERDIIVYINTMNNLFADFSNEELSKYINLFSYLIEQQYNIQVYLHEKEEFEKYTEEIGDILAFDKQDLEAAKKEYEKGLKIEKNLQSLMQKRLRNQQKLLKEAQSKKDKASAAKYSADIKATKGYLNKIKKAIKDLEIEYAGKKYDY